MVPYYSAVNFDLIDFQESMNYRSFSNYFLKSFFYLQSSCSNSINIPNFSWPALNEQANAKAYYSKFYAPMARRDSFLFSIMDWFALFVDLSGSRLFLLQNL